MDKQYIFESERLGFRRWEDKDKAPFARMNADSEIMKYFPAALKEEESDLLISRFEQHHDDKGYGIWAAERKEDGTFIGFIGLLEVGIDVDFKGAVEIGWRLDKKFWKKGYAAEGAAACLNYAFKVLKINEVCSFTAAVNQPSETVMKRIGMIKVKEFNHPKLEERSILRKHVLYRIVNKDSVG